MASDYKEVLAAASLMSNRDEDEIVAELVLEKYGKAYDTLHESAAVLEARPPKPTLPRKKFSELKEQFELPAELVPPVPPPTPKKKKQHGVREWGKTLSSKVAARCAKYAREIAVGTQWRRKMGVKEGESQWVVSLVEEVGVYFVRLYHPFSGHHSVCRADGFAVPSNRRQNLYQYHPYGE
jgi:hypothetical protein